MSIYWTVWLLGIAGTFGAAEAYALWKGKQTLSRYIWVITAAFPPFGWIAGLVTGFLGAHFFWGGHFSCF